MTEGQRVKLEQLIVEFEITVINTTLDLYPSNTTLAQELRAKAHDRITDHLSTIQRFSQAQTMLIKVYADELNSDSEDLLHKYRRLLEQSAR